MAYYEPSGSIFGFIGTLRSSNPASSCLYITEINFLCSTECKPNFVMSSLFFAISVPVHDHTVKDPQNGLPAVNCSGH